MVNMLTQPIGTLFILLILNTNHIYQELAYQMRRFIDFLVRPKWYLYWFQIIWRLSNNPYIG